MEERNQIEGTVDAVIYQNEENGYTVLRVDAGDQGGITVVGCMPAIAPGESISVQMCIRDSPNKDLSILEGAITASGWNNIKSDGISRMYFDALAKQYKFKLSTPRCV